MRPRAALPVLLLALAVALVELPTVLAAASYTLSVTPSVPVSLGSTLTMRLNVTGGGVNQVYTVSFDVRKPGGVGRAIASKVITTDNKGVGTISVPYPDSSFTPQNGTVATDVGGVYTVYVNQTSPTNMPVASAQFTVSSQLIVVVSQPSAGTTIQKGLSTTITASVSSLNGADTSATVYANTPSSNGRPILQMQQVSAGLYSVTYQVLTSDPIGSWLIVVQATDIPGNAGSSSPVTITVTKNDLIVDSLVTYNSKGVPSTGFSIGDTIYAFFRIRYSSGTYLARGQYPVSLRNPSGVLVENLTAAYDGSKFGFYTSSGYPISAFDPGGSWSVVVNANSVNDGSGDTGPLIATSVPIQIETSPLGYWPFFVAAAIGILGAVVTWRRFDTSLEGFDHLEAMMGGPVPRSSSILLLGDPGSGKTILAYELLHEELESGRLCALLSYDAFPEDVQARMSEFGWDIIPDLRKGRLKIIDCYSGLAGQGEGAIKDPSDLTELNIQITSFIMKVKNNPVTIVLDSLTPIFNGVEEKQAFNFLQTVSAKVKKTGGIFLLIASKGAIREESIAKIKSVVDGVIEVSLVRTGRKSHRFISVLKMERRKIASDTVPFVIDRNRGILFRVSRLGLFKKRHLKPLLQRKGPTPPPAKRYDAQPARTPTSRPR